MSRAAGRWVDRYEGDSDEDMEIRPIGKSRDSYRDRDRRDARDRDRQPRDRYNHSSDESDHDRRQGRKGGKEEGRRRDDDFEEEVVPARVRTLSRQPSRHERSGGGVFVPKTAQPYDRPPKPKPAYSEEPELDRRDRDRREQDYQNQNRNSNSNATIQSSEWAKSGRRDDFSEESRQSAPRRSGQGPWVKSGGWVDSQDSRDDNRPPSHSNSRDHSPSGNNSRRRKDELSVRRSNDFYEEDYRRDRGDRDRGDRDVRRSRDEQRDDRGSRETSEIRRILNDGRDADTRRDRDRDRYHEERHRDRHERDDSRSRRDRDYSPEEHRDRDRRDRGRDHERERRPHPDRDHSERGSRSRDYDDNSRDASHSRSRSDRRPSREARGRYEDDRGHDEGSGSSRPDSPANEEFHAHDRRRDSDVGAPIASKSGSVSQRHSPDGHTDNSLTPDTQSSGQTGLEGAFHKIWKQPPGEKPQEPVEDPTVDKPGPGGQSKPSFVLVAHPRGVRSQHIQCTVLRDRHSMQGKLYPQYELVLEEPRRTLIIARKMSMNRTSNYHLFDMTRGQAGSKLSKKAGNYLGKLRARNSQRTDYALLNQKADKEEIGAVVFDKITIMGQLKEGNQPRKMKVLLPTPDPVTGTVDGVNAGAYGLESLCDLLQEVADRKRAIPSGLMLIETKEPVLENGNYRLNFFGRVNLPSVKNFQMVHSSNIDNILCQFGKVDEDIFHLDFKAPFNAVQAFALALCQFNL